MTRNFLICGFALTAFLFSACAPRPVRVEGVAMLPNFGDGDRVMMNTNLGDLQRGEVITFLYPKDNTKWYFKRIIGLPGETLEIREGKVYINGQVLDEPYIDETYNQVKQSFPPRIVPQNHYFVMGDNRDNSSDSRYWGTVDKALIQGKYYLTYHKSSK